jgi:hypothetical protein
MIALTAASQKAIDAAEADYRAGLRAHCVSSRVVMPGLLLGIPSFAVSIFTNPC